MNIAQPLVPISHGTGTRPPALPATTIGAAATSAGVTPISAPAPAAPSALRACLRGICSIGVPTIRVRAAPGNGILLMWISAPPALESVDLFCFEPLTDAPASRG